MTYRQYQDLNPTYDPGDFLDSCNREQVERFLDVRAATEVLSEVIDKYLGGVSLDHTPRSFLDVGCGMGKYLIAAQRLGFDTLGFEPSANHARVATQHFNLPVIKDYFSVSQVGGKRFDLIMLSHVIEHIYDPKSFINELVEVLKPGGALIVITPNNDSLVARTIGRAWPMLKPVDHVSMIGAAAYDHFDLHDIADIHHSVSEYPFEFAASALAGLRSFLSSTGKRRSSHLAECTESAPPPLRGFGAKAKVLRYGMTAVSAPMHVAAIVTRRQACLKSIIIRRA